MRSAGELEASPSRIGVLLVVVVLAALVGGGRPAPAAAGEDGFAALDAPGPALAAAPSELAAALDCPTLGPGARAVLLVPGTTLDPETNFAWNYVPALTSAGFSVCTVALVDRGMGDIQDSVERVVHAIRTMHAATGAPIQVIGYSQGGQVPRFALRFWPDVRPMVDDLISLSAPNNGALPADGLCAVACAASIWQQRMAAGYIAALNSRATSFSGVDITSVYTRFDEVAAPNLNGESSALAGATNVALQDLCPLNVAEHIQIGTTDPVAYALVLDALSHPGPADPARVPGSVCAQVFLPGVDPLEVLQRQATLATIVAGSLIEAPLLTAEPPLRCYVTATCAESPALDEPATVPPGSVPVAPADPTPPPVGGASSLPATGATAFDLAALALLGVGLLLRTLLRSSRAPT